MMVLRCQKCLEISILILLSFMHSPVRSRFVVEKNNLHVTRPESLKGTYDSAMGNFGLPQYGGSMMGQVIYPGKGATGCKPFNDVGISFKRPNQIAVPVIVLVDRGDCFFALKAWNAQNAGAAAVLVVDDQDEPLITMDSPEEDIKAAEYLQKITIPSALVQKKFGEALKTTFSKGEIVAVKLDWTESLQHPDERVEYEFWINSNDECGPKCDAQAEFVKNFKGAAQLLERGGYTLFTPHYITWYCPESSILSKQCKSQCINHGRYCAPDPEQDFSKGYDGKDVVMENLRQLCVYKISNDTKMPWVWWDYISDFHIRCPMKEQKYNKDCAERIIKSLGLSVDKVRDCMGNPDADEDNKLLKAEQDAQVGQGSRGDVTILPTLVINGRQYRGKLDKGAVLKAVCAGFKETTEPSVCLSPDLETNECLTNNGGCWQNLEANITACKDTFRGRVCECPTVPGIQFQGDGYTNCESVGPGRCKINNGGCWTETKDGQTFSACLDSQLKGCQCPIGFQGDGERECEDIDECKERSACQCSQCTCKDTWGGYDCICKAGLLYIKEQDACIGSKGSSGFSWAAFFLFLAGFAAVCVGGYVIYKYRLRSYMDSEIRSIMAQYMPLDSQGDVQLHLHDHS